jgi:hypothetical protein
MSKSTMSIQIELITINRQETACSLNPPAGRQGLQPALKTTTKTKIPTLAI